MVAPNRKLRKINFFSSATTTPTNEMKPIPSAMNMDINKVENADNNNDAKEKPCSSSRNIFRSTSMSSTDTETSYINRIVIEDDDPSNGAPKEPTDSFQLSYKDPSQVGNHVSEISDNVSSNSPPHVNNETLVLNIPNASYINGDDDVINIQILYDPDQPTKPEL